jgi:hypothetical protein
MPIESTKDMLGTGSVASFCAHAPNKVKFPYSPSREYCRFDALFIRRETSDPAFGDCIVIFCNDMDD